MTKIYILDYGAGNVRSIVNALKHLQFEFSWIKSPKDFELADTIIFPGVGNFGAGMQKLAEFGFAEPLREWIAADKPFMGICVGMQCLCTGSQESDVPGLGIIDAQITKFEDSDKSVPHMGWNSATETSDLGFINQSAPSKYYFVHSFALKINDLPKESSKWAYSFTKYGHEVFVSSIQQGNIFATQFHPEKSGRAGLMVIESFLKATNYSILRKIKFDLPPDGLTKRIIACLDVRANDSGDLVVTKGDQYDVREKEGNAVRYLMFYCRNLGKPVSLAKRYYEEGADEITFLNITSFRNSPLTDQPMLDVLKRTSETVFVPLTIGGGIRDFIDCNGKFVSALEVAGEYFRSGADKISIGSDAVYATEEYLRCKKVTSNAITEISRVYGRQAVVISVDPKRIYVASESEADGHHVIRTSRVGPNGENLCWYQCTVKGGRETRDVDVIQLVTSCCMMGAGEILLNSMDHDGQNRGYDLELIAAVKSHVRIPVIASSGAGCVEHFSDMFRETGADAALAAGIFHRQEVPIENVKEHLRLSGYKVRQ